MSLEVVAHPSARAFLDRSEAWLLEREDVHNLILSLAYGLAEEGSGLPGEDLARPFFATVEMRGDVVGAAFRGPPHQVLLTSMPPSAPPAVARCVAERYPVIPAVMGPPALAESFAAEWSSLRGVSVQSDTEQRLYRVDQVKPVSAPGALRLATTDDAPLAAEWAAAFSEELRMSFAPSAERIAAWIERGHVVMWEDGGAPVSMAVTHGRTPRGARVGYVYTPPERRRRGYAGACVSRVSQQLLDEGMDFCVLYADLSNPTTNALYQRMGYEPVADVLDFHLLLEAPR